jgi:hypothetical protein
MHSHALTHSRSHSITRSLTHSLTPSLTHSLTTDLPGSALRGQAGGLDANGHVGQHKRNRLVL